jgi:hypothetical protein
MSTVVNKDGLETVLWRYPTLAESAKLPDQEGESRWPAFSAIC